MFRFFVIILVLFLAAMLIGRVLKNAVKGFFDGLSGSGNFRTSRRKPKKEEVIYNKDDVVVLKGDAKDKKKNETE